MRTPSALPVGQNAIFYQERTGAQPGTAEKGAAVWSVVQESPGGDLPPEPAIRAEVSVPELDLTMEMTIRRNADDTFPASHVIELLFRVPDNFEGRGIANVQRITFKGTEQEPGNALIGVAAPLDTNIFLIALTDAQTAIETNLVADAARAVDRHSDAVCERTPGPDHDGKGHSRRAGVQRGDGGLGQGRPAQGRAELRRFAIANKKAGHCPAFFMFGFGIAGQATGRSAFAWAAAAALTASCTFSKARTSIWRTRSREMSNSADRSSSVIGSSDRRRAWKMRRSRSLSTSIASMQHGAALLQLVLLDEHLLPGCRARRPASPATGRIRLRSP